MFTDNDLKEIGLAVIIARRALWDAEQNAHFHPGNDFYKSEVTKARKAYTVALKAQRNIVDQVQNRLL